MSDVGEIESATPDMDLIERLEDGEQWSYTDRLLMLRERDAKRDAAIRARAIEECAAYLWTMDWDELRIAYMVSGLLALI